MGHAIADAAAGPRWGIDENAEGRFEENDEVPRLEWACKISPLMAGAMFVARIAKAVHISCTVEYDSAAVISAPANSVAITAGYCSKTRDRINSKTIASLGL